MKSRVLMVTAVALLSAMPAFAEGTGTPFFFEFKGEGGPIPNKDSNSDGSGHSFFSIVFDQTIDKIVSLEVELRGLTHSEPADLDIYLYNLSNLQQNAELMTDRGDSVPVEKVDLIFNDLASGLPSLDGALEDGTYRPEGGTIMSLTPGSDVWILMIIDDSPGDTGSLNQWFIRGIGVPEPMSLSLLAVGALAFLRRRFVA